jgi:putative ABC transport system permease protein
VLALSLRGISARKLRTALTAFAVVLGIALVSGTYLLTDTINHAFDQVFETATKGVDVVVTPKRLFGTNQNAVPAPLKAPVLAQVRRAPGVAQADGSVFLQGQVYTKSDKPLITTGAPMFISDTTPARFDPFVYVQGHPPTAPDEVALDKRSADKAGYRLGDTMRISGKGPQESFRLAGIAKFGSANSLGGAAVAIVTPPVAQRLLQLHGEFTTIQVAAQQGVTPAQLAANVRRTLGRAFTVRTGAQQARSDAGDIKDQLGFLRTFLFVFAGISLFVGAFLIVNTYSITVAQRMREFALLRLIGANRRQVMRAVIGEAFLLGLAASILGFLAGFGLAPALKGLFSLFGADLPSSGIVLEARTVIVSIVAGTLITLVAAFGPALRATRVAPIAALQEASLHTSARVGRRRTVVAAALAVLGVVLMCLGLFGAASGGSAAGLVGAGAGVVFIGVGLLASHVVAPLATAVGWPLERLRGVSGRLARENAARNPRRTASTSAALMIGVALVAFVTIFAAGLKASVHNAVDTGFTGQLIAQNVSRNQNATVPASAARALAQVPNIRTVSAMRFSKARVAGASLNVTGVDPATITSVFHSDWQQGSAATLRRLRPGQAAVARGWAKDHHVAVGDRLVLATPTGAHVPVTVTGIYDDKAKLLTDLTVPNALMGPAFNVDEDAFLMAATVPGADADTVKQEADRAIKAQFPSVKVLTKQGFLDEQDANVNQFLALVYVLLGLAVVIAVFGIVNTLVLTIHERTRELGMLRAIGTSRRQVRQLVRYEAVITALIGGVLGIVLGAVFAVLVTIPLKDQGYATSIPVASLLVLLVLAGLVGVLAARWPARRAAKLDVLDALAYE